VPTQLQYLLNNHPGWLSRFSTVLLGGAPADSLCLEEARRAGVKISLTYGMTETASQIANLKPEEFLAGNSSNGRTLPHAQVTIYNEENQVVEKGEIGNIVVKSSSLFLGYYPQLLLGESFHTDDMGYIDSQGYLHIIGRNSQKIITGGENVYPQELEKVIKDTGLVQDVAVMGYPDQRWGEIVVAFYVPLDETIKLENIESELSMRLAKYKLPKLWIILETIPRNTTGKINYLQLKSLV
jgi:O-succinylbenzoic acid--CoA ligase